MNRTRIAIACCAAVAGTVALTTASQGAGSSTTTLYAKMSGKQEVPAGDPDGTGTATLTFLKNRRVRYVIRPTKAGLTFGAGHVHMARRGKSGEPIFDLFDEPKKVSGGALKGDSQITSREDLNKLAAHPGDFYVNIHNEKYGKGAIRGQLTSKKPG